MYCLVLKYIDIFSQKLTVYVVFILGAVELCWLNFVRFFM